MCAHQSCSYGPNMNTHHSILVAVNGRDSGWPALDWAAGEAAAHHSHLRIVHTISWPHWGLDPFGELAFDWANTNAPDRGAQILEDAARRAHTQAPHATITTQLEAGETAMAIVRAGRNDALIVVGRGRTRRRVGRSVARTVLRLARCPIAIIGTPATGKPEAVG